VTTPTILIISCSLANESRSRTVGKLIFDRIKKVGAVVDWVDLAHVTLPLCDGDSALEEPHALALLEKIKQAHGIVLCSPIYNYDVNAVAKNLIELTGDAWIGKVVGLAYASGGIRSYLAGMGIIQSLLVDFRCIIYPRFVHATADSFEGRDLTDEEVLERINEFAAGFTTLVSRLTG